VNRVLLSLIVCLGLSAALTWGQTPACKGCARDSHGRIERSTAVRRAFQRTHPCPSTGKRYGACPGWVRDHIKPLKRGGSDSVGNLQWQSQTDAKAKDKTE
jgi:hypothetical protein